MTTGYILSMGDRTTCGGVIIEGNPARKANNRPISRQGDKVTCGKDGNTYTITSGISFMRDNTSSGAGRCIAGTLNSTSGCPCRSTFIVTDSHAMKYRLRNGAEISVAGVPPTPQQPKHQEITSQHYVVICGYGGNMHSVPACNLYNDKEGTS